MKSAWMAASLAFTFGLSVLTGLLFGLLPAIRATRGARCGNPSPTPAALPPVAGKGCAASWWLRRSPSPWSSLTGAGLLLKSFWRIQSQDPGFRPENVLAATVDLPDSRYRTAEQMRAFHQTALSKLSMLPGVEVAGAVNWVPLGPGSDDAETFNWRVAANFRSAMWSISS
jgi:hypothetical protein